MSAITVLADHPQVNSQARARDLIEHLKAHGYPADVHVSEISGNEKASPATIKWLAHARRAQWAMEAAK